MNLWYKPCSVVYIWYVVFYLGFNTHTHNFIQYKWVLFIYQIKINDISHAYEFNDRSPVLCLPCQNIHYHLHLSRPRTPLPDPHLLQNFLRSHYREIDRPPRASSRLLHHIEMADKEVTEIKVRQTATVNIYRIKR